MADIGGVNVGAIPGCRGKINAFLPVFDEMMDGSLAMLEKAKVIQRFRRFSAKLDQQLSGQAAPTRSR